MDGFWVTFQFMLLMHMFTNETYRQTSSYVYLLVNLYVQKWTAFAFGNTYVHQTFAACVSNQYARF